MKANLKEMSVYQLKNLLHHLKSANFGKRYGMQAGKLVDEDKDESLRLENEVREELIRRREHTNMVVDEQVKLVTKISERLDAFLSDEKDDYTSYILAELLSSGLKIVPCKYTEEEIEELKKIVDSLGA